MEGLGGEGGQSKLRGTAAGGVGGVLPKVGAGTGEPTCGPSWAQLLLLNLRPPPLFSGSRPASASGSCLVGGLGRWQHKSGGICKA